ncbi:hypothetical protein [Pararhodospirillum photometricum]|uniref:Diguanylate cyclase/phosphodiesterase n=1 Tax=Pararhodospirillum photometricum DSM 122 TaxID=1150469 RepID=H6SNR0_PARPM|nr:hypothetical protein [Pararhodospirillum photometricum]CCG09391.1 Diguanylate cyclase/phosphodiesterase [Pararhodospirillum photometricum DSM 122]
MRMSSEVDAKAAVVPDPAQEQGGRLHFGIGARLWSAFLTIAALSAAVALIAFNSYGQATTTLAVITQNRLPGILAIARLAEESNGLLTALPNALLGNDASSLADRWREVSLAESRLHDAVRVVSTLPEAETWLAGFSELSGRISATLQLILSSLEAHQEAQRVVALESARLALLQQDYRHLLTGRGGLTADEIGFLVTANEITSMLNEAMLNSDPLRVASLAEQAKATMAHLDASLVGLSPGPTRLAAASFAQRLAPLVTGPDALADERALALKAADVANSQFERVRTLSTQFNARVQGMLAGIKASVDADRATAERQSRLSRTLIGLAGSAGLLVAVLVAWLYVGRGIVGRLNRLSASMRRIAGGASQHPDPANRRRRNLGHGPLLVCVSRCHGPDRLSGQQRSADSPTEPPRLPPSRQSSFGQYGTHGVFVPGQSAAF